MLKSDIGNSAYTKLTSTYSEIKNRLNVFAKKLNLHLSNLTFSYIFIPTKFHKNPIKFRFVTCATNSYSFHAGNFFFSFY